MSEESRWKETSYILDSSPDHASGLQSGHAPIARRVLHALSVVSKAAAADWSRDESLDALLESACSLCGVDHGFLAVLDSSADTLVLSSARGLFEAGLDRRFEPGMGLIGQVWKTGEPVVVDDYEAWTGRGIDLQAQGAHAVVVYPIRSGSTVLGVIGLGSDVPSHRFTESQIENVEILAHLVSTVMVGDRRVDAARERHITNLDEELRTRRLREQDQQVLDLVPGAIWVKDRENRILRLNRAAARSLGLDASEAEGRFLWEVDPENAALSFRRDLEVIDGGMPCLGDLEERIDPAGDRRWWRVDRTPLFDHAGQVESVVVLATDVTEEHLNRGRLEASRAAAARADRLRSHALAALSHEVRGPLGSLRDQMAAIESETAPPLKAQVAEVRESMRRMAMWIDDLLDFERVEATNQPVQSTPFDPRTLAEDVVDLAAQVAHDRGLELAVHVDANIPGGLCGDSMRLRQVLVQLLGHALRATSRGEVVLTVRSVLVSDRQCELRFEIHASDWAFPVAHLESMFGPYVLGDEALDSDTERGSVGLALAHRLVMLLRGRVGLESADAGDFSCWCTLPFDRSLTLSVDSDAPWPWAGSRILIVEDRDTIARVLERKLEDRTCLVDRASSAAEAAERLSAARDDGWRYDLTLVDEGLTKGNDSAWLDAEDVRGRYALLVPFGRVSQCRAQHEVPILTKPIRTDRLDDLLVEMLNPEPGAVPSGGTRWRRGESPSFGGRALLIEPDPIRSRLTQLALERAGVEVESCKQINPEQYDPSKDYSFIFIADGSKSIESSRQIEIIRQIEGMTRYTPLIGLCRSDSAIDRERCIAAGFDASILSPPHFEELCIVLQRVASDQKSAVVARPVAD